MISAQLPDPQLQPLLYEKVTKYILHGPYGVDNPQAKYMVNGKCHKLHSVISPPILRRFPRSQSQLKALKKTFQSIPVMSRGDQ